jgi:LPS sulfotransferase NodH
MFYVVASTPRCGSSHLCRLLWSTGMLGAPAEYFNYQRTMLRMAARLQPGNLNEYVRRIIALRTAPTGVFGFKAHWDQFRLVLDGGVLSLFPGLRYIELERADRIAQAVSLAKAEQSGAWNSRSRRRHEPVYRRDRIAHHLGRLERDLAAWKAHFQRHGIRPLSLTCESVDAEPDAAVERVLSTFGLAPDPALRIELPAPERQSEAENLEWIERFRRESGVPRRAGPP